MAVPAAPGVAANDKSATSQDRANGLVTGTIAAVGPGKAFPVWGPMNFLAYGVLADALTCTKGSNTVTVGSSTNCNVGDSVQSTLVPAGTTVKTSPGAGAITLAFPTQTWRGAITTANAAIRFPNGVPAGLTLAALVGAAVSDPSGYFPSGVTVLGVGLDGVSLQTSAPPTTAPADASNVPIEFALTNNCVTTGTDTAATFSGVTTPLGASVITFQLERSLDGGSTWICCNVGGFGTLAQYINPTGPVQVAFGDPEAGSLYRVNCLAFSSAVDNTTCRYRWSTTGQAGIVMSTPALS